MTLGIGIAVVLGALCVIAGLLNKLLEAVNRLDKNLSGLRYQIEQAEEGMQVVRGNLHGIHHNTNKFAKRLDDQSFAQLIGDMAARFGVKPGTP